MLYLIIIIVVVLLIILIAANYNYTKRLIINYLIPSKKLMSYSDHRLGSKFWFDHPLCVTDKSYAELHTEYHVLSYDAMKKYFKWNKINDLNLKKSLVVLWIRTGSISCYHNDLKYVPSLIDDITQRENSIILVTTDGDNSILSDLDKSISD